MTKAIHTPADPDAEALEPQSLSDTSPADPLDAFIAQYQPPHPFTGMLRVELDNIGITSLDDLVKAPVATLRRAVMAAAQHDAQALQAAAVLFSKGRK